MMKQHLRALLMVLAIAAGIPAVAGASCSIPASDTGTQLVNDINACLTSVSAGGLPAGATEGQFLGQGAAAPAWYSMSGDLSCSTTSPGACTVTGLRGMTLNVTAPANGQVPAFNSTNGDIEWTTETGTVPSGATEGQFLLEGTASPGWFTLGGDITGSATSPGQMTVASVLNGQTPVTIFGASAGSLAFENAAANGYSWLNFSGDIANSTSAPGSITVTGIRGVPVTSTAATNGFVLAYNSTNRDLEWVAQGGGTSLPSGATAGQFLLENAAATSAVWTTLTGDVTNSTGTPGNLTVNTVKAGQTPTTMQGASAGYMLFDGSSGQLWQLPTGDVGASTGTPGLLTVKGLQGRAVSAGAPTANEVLTWNATNSDWEPTAPGTVAGGTEGQFYLQGASSPGWFACSGDISCSTVTPGQMTVATIGGNTPVVDNGAGTLTSLTTQQFIDTPSVANPATTASATGVNSNYDLYLTSNVTWTLGASSGDVWASGQFVTFNVHQPSSGGPYTITFQAVSGRSLKWATGTPPTECSVASCVDIYQCEYLAQSTTYYCGLTLANVH